MTNAKADRSRLSDLLVEMRLVEDVAMQSALIEQRVSGRPLVRILCARGLVDEEHLTRMVAARLQLEAVSVAGVRVPDRVLGLVPAPIAHAHNVLPITVKRTNQAEVIYLVMADPLDAVAVGEVQRVSGRQVQAVMAKASELEQSLIQHYGAPAAPERKHDASNPAAGLDMPRADLPRPRRPSTVASTRPRAASSSGRPATPAERPPLASRSGGARGTGSSSPRAPVASSRPSAAGSSRKSGVSRSSAGRLTVDTHGALQEAGIPEPPPLGVPATAADSASVSSIRPVLRVPRAVAAELAELALADDLAEPEDPSTRGLSSFAGLEDARSKDSALESPPAEWDAGIQDWTAPSSADELGALGRVAAPETGPDEDPVTATALVEDFDWGDEVPAPEAFDVPAASDGPTTELSGSPRAEPETAGRGQPPLSRALLATALEIPIEWDDDSHPFEGPAPHDMRVGLERTAIIPASELGNLSFEPPPLDDPLSRVSVLAGSDDIPTSMALAEARAGFRSDDLAPAENVTEDEAEFESVADAALENEADVDTAEGALAAVPGAAADLSEIPVIEPSRLMSLIEEADSTQRDTGADERPFTDEIEAIDVEDVLPTPTPNVALASAGETIPKIRDLPTDTMLAAPSAASATTGPRGMVMTSLDGDLVAAQGVPSEGAASDATRHATALVASLRSGASLSSAQRAELVLALGRLLLDRNIISEAELLKALLQQHG